MFEPEADEVTDVNFEVNPLTSALKPAEPDTAKDVVEVKLPADVRINSPVPATVSVLIAFAAPVPWKSASVEYVFALLAELVPVVMFKVVYSLPASLIVTVVSLFNPNASDVAGVEYPFCVIVTVPET